MTTPAALNIFLLLDTSASMTGAPLEALKQGVSLIHNTLGAQSNRPVAFAAITYESQAKVLCPLQDVKKPFSLPELEPGGTSGLGGAFRLLKETLQPKVKTLVYVFTDGEEPSDEWEPPLAAIKGSVEHIYGMACGMYSRVELMRQFSDAVYVLRELTPDSVFTTFRAYVG
ncbi:MAG: VWA domain-containing protein [Anaerolineae bacterium]|nr:VWA domain-containing protein [Anaerolineae bacterium]